MNELMYEEIRRISKEINSGEIDLSGTREVIRAYERIMEYVVFAREQGILALESEENLERIGNGQIERCLKELLLLIAYGADPEAFAEIGWNLYFSGVYSAYDALRYLIYMRGALLIEMGQDRRICSETLISMMPERIRSMITDEEPFQ